ncbi:hypothetical protein [Georgenia deserti]|uniref:ATP synthase subunit I n=1 Tax=Georgenia deserti TaxID=2093781 RepID=A0ABW4L136_9MICO
MTTPSQPTPNQQPRDGDPVGDEPAEQSSTDRPTASEALAGLPTATQTAIRAMYTTMLVRMGIFVAALAVGGGVLGYLVAGMPGLWGGLLGAGIAALFMVATVVTMLVTANRSLTVVTTAAVGGWLVKMLLVFVVLLLISGRDFYSPGVFFIVLVVAVIGSLLIEALGVMRSRVPTVEPSSGGAQGGGPSARP